MNLDNIKEEYLNKKTAKDSLKRFWAEILLLPIFVASIWIRYLPAKDMEGLQALDPYFIFKQSQAFAYTNHIPYLDFSRYFPYASPQYAEDLGAAIIPATLYKLGPFLVFENYLEYAQFYTPLIGGLSVIAMYFIGKEIFNKTAGLTSAFFLGTIAAVMHRSSAGFFEKDPLGGFLGLISIYFFLRGWKKSSWISGILSGTALGLFTWSWGGSQFLWLLYALTVAAVLFINVDTENLIAVFTPTVILGAIIGFVTNPGSIWFTSTALLPSIGVLSVLWLRYLVEQLKLVEENYLDYFIPGVYSLGGIALILSPLYSNFIARKFVGLIGLATRDRSERVIRSTVAESTSMSANQLFTQLGSNSAGAISPLLGYLANIIGTWPLAFIGAAAIATSILTMLLVKYEVISEEITRLKYYQIFSGMFIIWVIVFSALFQTPGLAILPSLIMVVGGGVLIYMFESDEEDPTYSKIEIDWRYSLVLFWIFSTVIASILESRIIFLAAYPVSLAAGYTASKILTEAYNIDYSNSFENAKPKAAKTLVVGSLVALIVLVNASAGFVSIQNIGDSPNDLWKENLDYIENETDPGAVVMSWWDYGYHFQSLGERGTVADGGNKVYFTDEGYALPMALADFFTSENPKNNSEILYKHSVDYIVLDETMIGKYSAVSQIANRDNDEYQFMQQIRTSRNLTNSITRSGNKTNVEFSGRGFSAFVPVEFSGDQVPEAEISGPPTLQTRQGRRNIGCMLTEEGRVEFDVESSADFCLAIDPYFNLERGLISDRIPSRAVVIPKEISNHIIVELYLMDGAEYDFVEKVEEGSNDYVKMWKVNYDELEG